MKRESGAKPTRARMYELVAPVVEQYLALSRGKAKLSHLQS
jgi:hypothetical protein